MKEVKTQKQLAQKYGISVSTLRRWLKPIKQKLKISRKLLRECQLKKIYEFLDEP